MIATPPTHISVIIPVYNGGENFRRCLDALTTTSYANYEIVVVDDGSIDRSASVAERSGCRVLHTSEPRSGPAVARNLGVQAAHGDVVFFVDADVAVRSETVGLVAQTFADDPGLAALFGSYDDAPGAPNFLSQYKNLFHHYVHQHSGEQAASFWSGCGAMRRDVFLRHGGFDTVLYGRPCIEDIELGYRVTRSGGRIRLVKTLQVKHLKHWTVVSLLRSDIFDRGIPWTQLMMREKSLRQRPQPADAQPGKRCNDLAAGALPGGGLYCAVAVADRRGRSRAAASAQLARLPLVCRPAQFTLCTGRDPLALAVLLLQRH